MATTHPCVLLISSLVARTAGGIEEERGELGGRRPWRGELLLLVFGVVVGLALVREIAGTMVDRLGEEAREGSEDEECRVPWDAASGGGRGTLMGMAKGIERDE